MSSLHPHIGKAITEYYITRQLLAAAASQVASIEGRLQSWLPLRR